MSTDKPHNPEDKDAYVDYGADEEHRFVDHIAPTLGLDAQINPEKEHNEYAIDLVVDGELADLKKQETPFFTARDQFGLDPQYTVTFNTNDYERYREKDDGTLDILFWVHWIEHENYGTEVSPMAGVWRVPFSRIVDWVEGGKVSSHEYIRRDAGGRNATSSYGLSLQDMERLAVVGPQNDHESNVDDAVLFL